MQLLLEMEFFKNIFYSSGTEKKNLSIICIAIVDCMGKQWPINHDDDVLFNIHGTLQQFLLAVSLNSWIRSRKITTTLLQVKKQRHREIQDFWITHMGHWYSWYKNLQSCIWTFWCSSSSHQSFWGINFQIRSLRYFWKLKKYHQLTQCWFFNKY